MSDTTDWYPKGTQPKRSGVYKTKNEYLNGLAFQNWNGKFWGGWGSDPAVAKQNAIIPSINSQPEWCGLLQEAK